MTTTLITGANKGLGKETARRLIEAGHTVYIGARDKACGRTAADDLGARFVAIDITDDASVTAAVESIAGQGGLDVLINNAGVEPRLPWMKQADIEDGKRPGLTDDERKQLREANKRIRLLEQENEVLRRAAAYLSQANLPGR